MSEKWRRDFAIQDLAELLDYSATTHTEGEQLRYATETINSAYRAGLERAREIVNHCRQSDALGLLDAELSALTNTDAREGGEGK